MRSSPSETPTSRFPGCSAFPACPGAPIRRISSRDRDSAHRSRTRRRDYFSSRLSYVDVLHQLPRADFTTVDVAFRVHGDALRRARPLHFERVGNTVKNLAVLEASDPDTSLPSRVRCDTVGFGVGHVEHVVAQGHAARAAELLPFRDERAVLPEDLDAHVSPVGDEEP